VQKGFMVSKNKEAFTLVELSIVLVIIGLVVGGVVGGQSLIRSSRLNAVVADVQKFKTAINTFELQYDALPGDMTDAWDYWGTDCHAIEAGCNGDGNNEIDNATTVRDERIMFWKHLYLSDILSRELNSSTWWPLTPLNNDSGYSVEHYHQSYTSGKGAGVETHYILVSTGLNPRGYVFTPAEAYLLDKKNDNGLPGSGQMKAFTGDTSGSGQNRCSTSQNTETSRYNLDNDSIACTLYFLWD
jgi:prepilin-type N-terminal cleavage/methylation domain-containing protein